MNKSIMMGRVVNEPDLRYTQTENGELAIANFRLAVNRKFVRRGDPEADFFSCTAFGRKAEFAEKYLFKGIKILVEGRMQNDNYKNRAGENVYGMRLMIEEISFAESKKALESGNDEREEPERETRESSNRNRFSVNREGICSISIGKRKYRRVGILKGYPFGQTEVIREKLKKDGFITSMGCNNYLWISW